MNRILMVLVLAVASTLSFGSIVGPVHNVDTAPTIGAACNAVSIYVVGSGGDKGKHYCCENNLWSQCDVGDAGVGGGHTIKNEGVSLLPTQPNLDFVGSGVDCANVPPNTVCTFTGGSGTWYKSTVLARSYVTGGTGTAGSPYTGWTTAFAAGRKVVFEAQDDGSTAYYQLPQGTGTALSSGTVIEGVGARSVIVAPPTLTSTKTYYFSIPAGTTDVAIRNITFGPGTTVPDGGLTHLVGGIAQNVVTYVQIGSTNPDGSVVKNVMIERVDFGVARYTTSNAGSHIKVTWGALNGLTVRDCIFDFGWDSFDFDVATDASAAKTWEWRNISIENNIAKHDQTESTRRASGWIVFRSRSTGMGGSSMYWPKLINWRIVRNTVYNHDSIINMDASHLTPGKLMGVVVSGNQFTYNKSLISNTYAISLVSTSPTSTEQGYGVQVTNNLVSAHANPRDGTNAVMAGTVAINVMRTVGTVVTSNYGYHAIFQTFDNTGDTWTGNVVDNDCGSWPTGDTVDVHCFSTDTGDIGSTFSGNTCIDGYFELINATGVTAVGNNVYKTCPSLVPAGMAFSLSNCSQCTAIGNRYHGDVDPTSGIISAPNTDDIQAGNTVSISHYGDFKVQSKFFLPTTANESLISTCDVGYGGRVGVDNTAQGRTGTMAYCNNAATPEKKYVATGDKWGNIGLQDFDHDGLPDYAYVGDYSYSATYTGMNDLDINTAIVALTDSPAVIELGPGVFTLDSDADGVGDTYASTGWNPHVRLRSNLTFKGQGQDITILRLNASTSSEGGYGTVPLVGTDSTGTTTTDPAARVVNVHVSDMTIETTVATSRQAATPFVPGLALWDCDDCSADRITVRRTPQAAVHITRCTNTVGNSIYGYHVGNYDTDGATATDTPGGVQPCLYLYTSRGFVQTDSGFRNSKCDGVGTNGVNIRSTDVVLRPVPLGESEIFFTTGQTRIAQVFTQVNLSGGDRPSAVVVWLRKKPGSAQTGSVEVEIQTVDGSNQPSGTAVTGYGFGSFANISASTLTPDFAPYRIVRTSATPAALSAATKYALVLRYTTGDGDNEIGVQYDTNATDTYTGGASFKGSTDTPTTTLGTGYDLNFEIENGTLLRNFATNIVINDVAGINGVSLPCASFGGSVQAWIDYLKCTNADEVVAGLSEFAFGARVAHVDVEDIPTAAAGGYGFRVGSYAPDMLVEKSSVKKSSSTTACLSVAAWARGVTFDTVSVERCAGAGIIINSGVRNTTVKNSRIVGTLGLGIDLSQSVSDTDGVLAEFRNTRVEGNTIRGTGGIGIKTASDHVHRGLFVQNNTFEDIGGNPLDIDAASTSAGPYVFSGNYIAGFGTTGTSSGWGIYLRNGGMQNLTVTNNTIYGKTGGSNEDRCIQYTFTGANADFWTITNNLCVGSFAQGAAIIGSGSATKEMVFSGNMPAYLYSQVKMAPLSDGRIMFGSGTGNPDAFLARLGANQIGADAGDELVGSAAVRTGGTSGPKWTSGTGAPSAACALGDLYSRTDGSTSTTLYVCTSLTPTYWTAK